MAKPKTIPRTETTLDQAADKDLQYWIGRKQADLEKDPDGKYANYERDWIAEAKRVLSSRGVDPNDIPPPAPPRTQQQAAPPAQQRQASPAQAAQPKTGQLAIGTFSNSNAASTALLEAAKRYHLVAPATMVGRLPEGCDVAIALVQIDPYGPGVYNITGDRKNPKEDDTVGLDGVSLNQIGGAAGITWLYSRRTDDGSHPHYCSWEAKARFRNFDLSYAEFIGSVEIDTREDGDIRGAAAEEIRAKAAKSKYDRDNGDSQLLELRKFIVRHAESKAMNRAIAKRGVRRSYKRKDLEKPFAVAQLLFTGHSDDPEARRDFRQMIGQQFLQASSHLYGATAQQHVQAPMHAIPAPAYAAHALHAPPPVGSRVVDDAYGHDDDQSGYVDVPQPQPTPKPATQAAAEQQDFPT
jgi:hypothetical protein